VTRFVFIRLYFNVVLPFKIRASTVPRGLYRKVNPDHVRLLLYQQFIEIFVVQVADVE
jgi:hypothetical protein